MVEPSSGGKSVPSSIIQPTELDRGGGERRRAPIAEYVPAPPMMFVLGVRSGAFLGG